MTRRVALQIGVPVLLAFIAWNAYLSVNHLRMTQQMAALAMESSAIQGGISNVLQDLTDMETSQRGYLLTGDDNYLQPYTDAQGRIGTDLVELRGGLAKRSQHEQSLESQLESLAIAKHSEMERAIKLRQRGYRHRSFALVATNEGEGYMDEVRRIAFSLLSEEGSNLAKVDNNRNAAVKRGLSITVISNAGLFVLAGCLFGLFHRNGRLLEKEASQSRRGLALRDLQLEELTSALSGQARSEISAIASTSRLLLENYGGFLPRQGHEYAEQMKEAAIQIERLRLDLVGSLGRERGGQPA